MKKRGSLFLVLLLLVVFVFSGAITTYASELYGVWELVVEEEGTVISIGLTFMRNGVLLTTVSQSNSNPNQPDIYVVVKSNFEIYGSTIKLWGGLWSSDIECGNYESEYEYAIVNNSLTFFEISDECLERANLLTALHYNLKTTELPVPRPSGSVDDLLGAWILQVPDMGMMTLTFLTNNIMELKLEEPGVAPEIERTYYKISGSTIKFWGEGWECGDAVGVYEYMILDDRLILNLIADDCADRTIFAYMTFERK